MSVTHNTRLTFRQYFILNKATTIHCLKISSLVFGIFTTIGVFAVGWKTGEKTDTWDVFIASELFTCGIAVFIFILAILDGYTKAKKAIHQFNKIDPYLKQRHSIELVQRPLNPKFWFMQFDIVRKDGDKYRSIDEELKKLLIK